MHMFQSEIVSLLVKCPDFVTSQSAQYITDLSVTVGV